jgi:hypothetical protein
MTERFGGMTDGTDDGAIRPLGLLAGRRQDPADGAILKGGRLCFINADGHLVVISDGRLTTYPGKAVVASRATRDAFIFIERSVLVNVKVIRAGRSGELETTTAAVDLVGSGGTTDDIRYYFGAGGLANLIAYSPTESRCTIIHRLETVSFRIHSSHTVIGMVNVQTVEHGRTVDRPFAVAIDGNRTGIVLLRPGENRRLLTTTTPITSAAASDAAPVIAFITQSREIGVYSCSADAMVLRLASETMA